MQAYRDKLSRSGGSQPFVECSGLGLSRLEVFARLPIFQQGLSVCPYQTSWYLLFLVVCTVSRCMYHLLLFIPLLIVRTIYLCPYKLSRMYHSSGPYCFLLYVPSLLGPYRSPLYVPLLQVCTVLSGMYNALVSVPYLSVYTMTSWSIPFSRYVLLY